MKLRTTGMIVLSALLFAGIAAAGEQKKTNAPKAQPEKPVVKMSDIPGITTPDKTPNACVDCHANHPEMKKDFRLTTLLTSWQNGSDSDIVAKAQIIAPGGRKLNGKHPDVRALVKIVPDDCLMCHSRDSKIAPPFMKLLHAIHLEGGEKNHFLSMASGTCTSCHKLDQKSGTMGLGSGEEK